jgi:hypothetical protein
MSFQSCQPEADMRADMMAAAAAAVALADAAALTDDRYINGCQMENMSQSVTFATGVFGGCWLSERGVLQHSCRCRSQQQQHQMMLLPPESSCPVSWPKSPCRSGLSRTQVTLLQPPLPPGQLLLLPWMWMLSLTTWMKIQLLALLLCNRQLPVVVQHLWPPPATAPSSSSSSSCQHQIFWIWEKACC